MFGVLIVYAGQATGGESTKGQALCFLFVFGVPIVYAGQATGGESIKSSNLRSNPCNDDMYTD